MNKPESTPADAMNRSHIGAEELIDDRRAEGIFRVHRSAFLDPGIFELEMSKVFESTWVFIGLESQVARPHDFITSHIGRQPIILTRTAGGTLGCFLNSCRHRGMLLCPFSGGNQKFHVCRYHGWVYDSSGRNAGITDQQVNPAAARKEIIAIETCDQLIAGIAGDAVITRTPKAHIVFTAGM